MSPSNSKPAATTTAAPQRRAFIRLLGGGAVLAAAGGAAGCSATLPDAALQPWRSAAGEADARRYMLAHALLAPNPHNRQPWLADLREPGRIHLVCDGERLLPETDPFGRQILIGCGAFIELAVLAAAQRGLAVAVTPFPQGAPAAQGLPAGVRVATLQLGAPGSAAPDALFEAIGRRHTAKSAYADARAMPAALASAWSDTARALGLRSALVTEPAAVARLRGIARRAYEVESTTPATWLESARLMRIGPQAIATHRDGISLNSPMVRLLHGVGLFDPLEVPKPGQASLQRVMERWTPFDTGSGFAWLAGPDNSRATQLACGRAFVRQQLQATAVGVSMHPLSQALQEFAAMRPSFEALHAALGQDAGRAPVQMFSRVGYALQPATPSPRRALDGLLRM